MPIQNIYQYTDVAGHNNVAISQLPISPSQIRGACHHTNKYRVT
jgi:hypothetical protein